jgi:hypothetical protein
VILVPLLYLACILFFGFGTKLSPENIWKTGKRESLIEFVERYQSNTGDTCE